MSNNKPASITTPIGRIVAGDVFEPRTTDHQGNPLTIKTGPNTGQPTQKYFIALAIPKTEATFNEVWALMNQVAQTGFPNLFNNGSCIRPDFAWKYTDGDSNIPNRNNTKPCDKEGYPGHHVINMESSLAPKVYDRNNQLIAPESRAIKRGDFARVYISIAANNNAQNPGLYVNPVMIQFSYAGEEIHSGPDAAAVFGANPMPAAPAGAVTTPQPSMSAMPTGTTNPPPVVSAMTPGTPSVTQTSAPAPVSVQPAHDFLNPAAAVPPAPKPVIENFIVNGTQYSREQLRVAGWTDEQINAQPKA